MSEEERKFLFNKCMGDARGWRDDCLATAYSDWEKQSDDCENEEGEGEYIACTQEADRTEEFATRKCGNLFEDDEKYCNVHWGKK